jgi:alanine-synthesizing transaminase
VREIAAMYEARRDVLCKGLQEAGWEVEIPKATMFVWARIPDVVQEGIRARIPAGESISLDFCRRLIAEAKVAVSPGIGFGEYGDDHVRFGLIENEHRTRQAIRGIKEMFRRESRSGA